MNAIRSARRPVLFAGAPLCLSLCLVVTACHRDEPQDHLAKGKAAATKQDHATAIIEFKNVLQADPKSGEARMLLGRELLAQGDAKGAEIELQKAYDANYSSDVVVPLLVKSQLMQGLSDKVVAQIAKGDLASPAANAEMQTLLGNMLVGQGKADGATTAYNAALKFVPDYAEAHIGIARIKLGAGDAAGAQSEVDGVLGAHPTNADALVLKGDLARARNATDEAIAAYQAAIHEAPRAIIARLDLAGVYVGTGKLDLAQAQVDEMKKIAPKLPGVNYMDALVSFGKKDYAHANEAVNLALLGAPTSGLSQLLAGAISTALKEPEQAEAHLIAALKSNPSNLYARKLLTSLYLRQRQPAKADEILQPALAKAPDDPALVGLAGELAVAKGDFAAASKYFDRAAKMNPTDSNARTQGAALDFARGDEAGGFAALEAASKDATTNANPDIALVLAHVQRKQYDQAFTAWKTLQKRQPDNPITYNLRAAIELGRGDTASAREALEHAVQLQPNYYPAVANLAALDERKGDIDGARKRFKTLLAKDSGNLSALLALAQFESMHGGTADVVVPLLQEARRANPGSEQPVVALASYYVSTKDPKQALTIVQQGLAGAPNSPTYLNLSGQLLLETGSLDQGVAAFKKLATLDPDSLERKIRLGQAQIAANQADAAVQTFTSALAKQPTAYQAQSAAVGSLLRANKVDEATSVLATIEKQSPKSPVLTELHGDVQLVHKEYAEAATTFRRALAQAPNSNLAIKTFTALRLGDNQKDANAFIADWIKAHPKDAALRVVDADVALRTKDYGRAAQDYRAVLDANPNDVIALNNLAWTLSQQHDPQALAIAQKAIAIAPNNPQVGDTLGWMLVEQGQTKRGLEYLEKANAAAPTRHDITLHLAKAQLKDGRKDAARTTLQALVTSAPESAEAKESKDIISSL